MLETQHQKPRNKSLSLAPSLLKILAKVQRTPSAYSSVQALRSPDAKCPVFWRHISNLLHGERLMPITLSEDFRKMIFLLRHKS